MSDDVTGSTQGVSGEEGYAGTDVGRRTILNLVGIVTANVARLVALAMVGHAGGPSTLGNIQSVVSAANLAALAGPSSMGAAAGRYLPVAQDAKGTAKRLMWQGSTLGVVLAIVCGAALLPFFGPEVALAAALFTVVMCVWLVARGVVIGRGSALRSMLWVEVGAALALVVAMAALVWWGAPWPSYVLALMLLNLPLAVWVWAQYRSLPRATSVGPGYGRYVGFAVVGTIASAGLVHLTNLVTNGLGGTVQAGYLAAGLLLLSPLGMALAALAQVSLPWLSRLVSEGRDREARRRVHQLTASTQFTMGTVLLVLIPCGPWLGRVAFGADMRLDYPLLIVLGCATLALGTRMGSGVFLSARGARDVQRMAGLSYVGLAVALVVWGVTYAAVGGVPAVSAGLGYALGSAAVTVLIIRVALGVRASTRVALGLALWSAVAWCVTYAVAHPSWPSLAGAVAAGLVWVAANREGVGHLADWTRQRSRLSSPSSGTSAPRVLHSMLMATPQPGIYQQMSWEQEAAEAEGLPWDVRIFTSWPMPDPAGITVPWSPPGRVAATKAAGWFAFRRAYYAWLRRQALEYDVVLVRHSPHDPLRPGAVKKLTGLVGTVGTVHHTRDVPELRTRRPRHMGVILSAAEALLGPRSLRWTDMIIGVTPEIAAYAADRVPDGKPMLVYPNGALVTGQVEDQRAEVPELLFVAATFQPWHGLDLLLDTLDGCPDEFVLHVVGNVGPHVSAGCQDPRVVFHGVLDVQGLRRLTARAWVGISSLALERQGMTQASPLKVREYLAWGLPVYAGHRDVIPAEDLAFRIGPPDVARILMFARETRGIPKQEIRAAVVESIDKRVLVRDLYAALAQMSRAGQEK